MKVLINRKPRRDQPYGGGNLFVIAFCDVIRQHGHEVVHTLDEDLDRILLMDPRYDELGISLNEIVKYREAHPDTFVVHRVNECDARKGTRGMDETLGFSSRFSDRTVFVSNWMKSYHLEKGWHCDDTTVIYNGVNLKHFREGDKKAGRTRVVAHHWSDNPMKGQDVYEHLDDLAGQGKIKFTYIGRTKAKLKNTEVISPLFGGKLGEALAKYHDVYVTGTRFDPGPNHVIEAIACNLPVLAHADGGGAVEFAGSANVYSDLEGLDKLLLGKKWQKKWGMRPASWEDCITLYMKALDLETAQ